MKALFAPAIGLQIRFLKNEKVLFKERHDVAEAFCFSASLGR